MKKLASAIVFLVVTSALTSSAQEARTLKDRIRSVSNRMYIKSGRLEMTLYPATSLSLNDAFFQKFGLGAQFAYHISEAFALQAMFTYSLNLETEYASYHGSGEETVPYAGKRTFLVGADFCWSPIYGKISLAAEWILHFDTYLMGGIGLIGGEQESDSSFGFAGAFGLGARIFFSRLVALKLELKDYMVFNDKVTFNNLEPKSDVQHQLLLNVGLSFFFLDGSEED